MTISHSWTNYTTPIPIKTLFVKSLDYQDDDLRIDIDGITKSNTRLNVSQYNGTKTSKVFNFNPNYIRTGFREIILEQPNAGSLGSIVEIYTTDVGGGCKLSKMDVTATLENGTVLEFRNIGQTLTITPPSWPEGTIGLPTELRKSSSERDYLWAEIPPIYVPNASFYIQ